MARGRSLWLARESEVRARAARRWWHALLVRERVRAPRERPGKGRGAACWPLARSKGGDAIASKAEAAAREATRYVESVGGGIADHDQADNLPVADGEVVREDQLVGEVGLVVLAVVPAADD